MERRDAVEGSKSLDSRFLKQKDANPIFFYQSIQAIKGQAYVISGLSTQATAAK
jgi:hypothetical protein